MSGIKDTRRYTLSASLCVLSYQNKLVQPALQQHQYIRDLTIATTPDDNHHVSNAYD